MSTLEIVEPDLLKIPVKSQARERRTRVSYAATVMGATDWDQDD